ncbi:MAG: hypothetical protein ABII82_04905 [Verrucomicrobiota bacterium]
MAATIAWALWTPGKIITDGRHDLGRNAIWLGHGWLGADDWFLQNGRDPADFRQPAMMIALSRRLEAHGVRYVYPHLCPAGADGSLPEVNDQQVEAFLQCMDGFQVLPWVGGVHGQSARIDDSVWRANFCASIEGLFQQHPMLAGIHLNVEPCPSGSRSFLLLLEELRRVVPKGKLLSVAAYPPPTRWQPSLDVHWSENFFREVAARSNQMAVMMYDTGLRWQKPYVALVRDWTRETMQWAGRTELLIGLPAYDDAGVGWHDPDVENLTTALAGLHAGLEGHGEWGASPYAGIAIYSEWEMDEAEWSLISTGFGR